MQDWTAKLFAGSPLTADQAEAELDRFMDGSADEAEMAAVLTALKVRGETAAEIAGGVRALRKAMVPVQLPGRRLVDTCGTGGGALSTFNISTASALVAAGGGVKIAKHGNRSYSSKCGSADVLEALGVEIDLGAAAIARVFRETGLAFMYAPRFHPAMRHVAPVRRSLGVSTLMNILGPLANPAGVRRQVVGVALGGRQWLVAEALRELGHERALVVHGEPGLDELSPLGPTTMVALDDGKLTDHEVSPADFGWTDLSAEQLAGGEPAQNAQLVEDVIQGRTGGTARAAVVLNAAAAFYVGGATDSLEDGVGLAEASIDSGNAHGVLEALRESTRAARREQEASRGRNRESETGQ